MTTAWNAEQILALAPDGASAKAGKDLAAPRKWVSLGQAEGVAWGECQGSGKLPYQTSLDLHDQPAYHCSCPSRKLPCKHTLGLFLLLEKEPTAFAPTEPPAWIAQWLAARHKRSEQKREREARAAPVSDGAAQARRARERQAKAEAGMRDLELWMRDLGRQGLANVSGQPLSFWNGPASRLVDAQLPGLARLLRETSGLVSSGEGWQGRVLARLGQIWALVEGFKRLDQLPASTQADIKTALGWTYAQDELAANEGLRDHWFVVGQHTLDEEHLKVRRTWLWGQTTGRAAILLHFSVNGQPFEAHLPIGASAEAELVFYPGAYPLRAIVKGQTSLPHQGQYPVGYGSVGASLTAWSRAIGQNPWLEEFPMLLEGIVPRHMENDWLITDATGESLPLSQEDWRLLALSGGQPVSLFGEWDGESFLPLSMQVEGRFLNLDGPSGRSSQLAARPGTTLWSAVVTAALVGTDRQTPAFTRPTSLLGDGLATLEELDPPAYLLGAATLVSQYDRAGQLPDHHEPPEGEAAVPTETDLPVCTARAGQHLVSILTGRHELLGEWLTALTRAGQRVPDKLLPSILELNRSRPELRSLIQAALGGRGSWLTTQNPDWRELVASSADPAQTETDWQTGSPDSRLRVLQELRQREPAKARELVGTEWATEKADDRVTFLATFQTNLTIDDEPFLEKTLDDRSKGVRRTAADLLARLPTSRLVQRMIERVSALVTLTAEPGGKGEQIQLTLPIACDKAMERDGIEPKPGLYQTKRLGERAWWLQQMIGTLPPTWWNEHWPKTPAELLKMAQSSEWKNILTEGWRQATLRYGDLNWAVALLETRFEPNLLSFLPPVQQEAYILARTEQPTSVEEKHQTLESLLHNADFPWSVELSRALLRTLRYYVSGGLNDRFGHDLKANLRHFAHHIPPAFVTEAGRNWPTDAPGWAGWEKAVEEFLALLQFRHDMLKEFVPVAGGAG